MKKYRELVQKYKRVLQEVHPGKILDIDIIESQDVYIKVRDIKITTTDVVYDSNANYLADKLTMWANKYDYVIVAYYFDAQWNVRLDKIVAHNEENIETVNVSIESGINKFRLVLEMAELVYAVTKNKRKKLDA